MKSEEDILRRRDEIVDNKVDRAVDEAMSRFPGNCVHNRRHEEDGREVGICTFAGEGEDWTGMLCDDEQTARECPFFDCRHDPEKVEADVRASIQADLDNHPAVRELEWMLEDAEPSSWWKRLADKLIS